jgi:hypothetical protein
MARHVCDNCGATVVDEEFCPTCGSWIDPLTTGRNGDEFEEFDLEEAPPALTRRGEPVLCPSCGAPNPPGNRHCEECGARLRQGPLPTAPRPGVQATAGVRAVIALSGLLALVVIAALLINVFGGETTTTTTTAGNGDTTTTTAGGVPEAGPINILVANCTPPGLQGSFACSNLISGTDAEFQINWNELPETEKRVVIQLTFDQPMVVQQIHWENIADEERFRLNYRAKGLTIEAEGNALPFLQELENAPGLQTFPFAAIRSNSITITIQSVYPAEVFNGREPYNELAIQEVTVIGYKPLDTVTTTTAGTTTTAAN